MSSSSGGGGGRRRAGALEAKQGLTGAAGDVLARRLRGALPGRGFQRMDYDALRSKIRENKQMGAKAAKKIHGIKKHTQSVEAERRDEFHKHVWTTELARLNALSNQAQREFQAFLDNLAEDSRNEGLLRLIFEHNEEERRADTDVAALHLRFREAQAAARRSYRRHRPSAPALRGPSSSFQRHTRARNPRRRSVQSAQLPKAAARDQDLAFLRHVREDLEDSCDQLREEEAALFHYLQGIGCVEGCALKVPASLQQDDHSGDNDANEAAAGAWSGFREFEGFARVWEEDFSTILDGCDFPDLANHLSDLFQESLEQCRERVVDLHDAYLDVITSPFGGWDANDHYMFDVSLSAYTSLKLPSQFQFQGLSARQLAFELLSRVLPHTRRQGLVAHEDFVAACKFYATMKREVFHANQREMRACLDDIRGLLADELLREQERRQQLQEQAKHQQLQLERMQRLLELRRQRLERVEEEMKKQREAEAHANAVRRKEEQREHRYRKRMAQALEAYKAEQARLNAMAREQEEQRRRELDQLQRQQAAANAERVSYRHEQFEQKQEEQKERRNAEEVLEREREAKLEAIRQQVRPQQIPDDPGRLLRPTKAMDAARQEAKWQREVRDMLPNMDVIGYDDKRITSDPRFKLAQALNKAGLGNTDYARQAMMKMRGAAEPRKDAESTLFRPDGGFRR